jgi:hypothetical protein
MKLFYFLLLLPFYCVSQNNNTGSSIANTFINSLDSVQKSKTVFTFDTMARYEWHYVPPTSVPRQGIAIRELNSAQKQTIYNLLKTYLSSNGYTRTQDIMNTEYLLKELEPNSKGRIPENYFVSFYGNPVKDKTWGWKITGHHLALNYTIVDNQLAFAPFFFGVYPAVRTNGKTKDKNIFQDEEELGFKLVNALSKEQKSKAIFNLFPYQDIVTKTSHKVVPFDTVGIIAENLTLEQKHLLNQLIVTYLSNMPSKIAKLRMERIVAEDFNKISFGWAGSTKPGEPHYYRIQGKTFLIELDNTQNNANHVHTVWRDFNGDYGIDLLNEHYKKSKHHHK